MEVKFESAVAATMGGAKTPNGGPPTREQIEEVVRFLRSAESGPGNGTSFMDFVQQEIERHPPNLREGQDYVAYSGADAAGMNNGRNAQQYLDARSGKAGLIGETPWGKFISSQGADEQIRGMIDKFQEIMGREGLKPFNEDYAGALRDMMWNAGSSPYLENAVKSGRPIIAFVENAPQNRGFSNFELPVALEHPDVVMNGYPMRVFGAGDDALAFASRSAAEYQAFERYIADSATRNSGREVSVADVRSQLDIAGGYNAIDKTVFGMPRASFEQLPFDDMRSAGVRWSQAVADQSAIGNHRSEVGVAKAPVVESHRPTGPPQAVVTEAPPSAVVRMWHAAEDEATKIATGKTPIRMGIDGLPNDDVPHYLASQKHLRSYEQATAQMREFKVPPLWDRTDPHSYMLIGLLDGTGNDVFQDPLHATNVAKLREEVRALKNEGVKNVDFEYVPGPGTQENFFENTIDGATGRTSLARAEEMYKRLVENAAEIHKADPHAKISFHLEGFSRGASTVPLLARMIHERGIPDTRSAVESIDEQGNTVRTYTRYLQPPGHTPMSVGLYDPVATGYLEDYFDRRLPPSVVSGFQINAAHERRGLFPVDRIIPEGQSQDGRFLSVTVAGVHSDIGGSYLRGGLGDRSLNLMTDYRNTMLGEPLFQRVHETTDPRMNVIHHSTDGNLLFRHWPKIGRDTPAGEIRQLVPDYTYVTPQGQVVHLPDQTPEPAGDMAQRLRAKAVSVAETLHIRPVEQSGGEAMLARVTRESDVVLRPYEPPLQLSTGTKVVLGVTAAGGVLSLVEAADTGHRAAAMLELDNPEAARAVLEKYGAKAFGGWAGGALAGAAVGWETGPGVLGFVIVGAVAGSEVGDRAAQHWNDLKIYRQTDSGIDWTFNGRVWQRDGKADTTLDGNDQTTSMPITASYEKSRDLNFMAMNAATVLAMGKVPPPLDPFTIHAKPGDRHSLVPVDWKLDAQTGTWQREVVTQIIEHGQKITDIAKALPERAAELSEASLQIMQANIANGPVAIAQRYEAAYVQLGSSGKMPDAVHTALTDQDRLMASDGKVYARQADGEWVHHNQYRSDENAQGRLRLELNASRVLLQAGAMQHAQSLNSIEPQALRSPESAQRDEMMYRYRIVGTELQPDWQEAIQLATQRTREAHGITGPGPTQLKRTADGQVGADSPIAHLQQGSDGADRIIAITSSEDIRHALEEVRARPRTEASVAPHDPEQRIAALTPEQRDARDQTMREANRQGLSRDDVQQTVQWATIEVRGKRADPESVRETPAEKAVEPEVRMPTAQLTPSPMPPPSPEPQRDSDIRDQARDAQLLPAGADDRKVPVQAAHETAPRPSQEHFSDGRVVEAERVSAPNQSSPQQVTEPPSRDSSRSARVEFEDRPELATAPTRTIAGGGVRSPVDDAQDREESRNDRDRREVQRAESQAVPSAVPQPFIALRADAREQDEEEKRNDHDRRSPETSQAAPPSERAMPDSTMQPLDPRHPDHPDHRTMYLNAREKIADLYERNGIPMHEGKLELTTAAVLLDARANRMTHIEEVQFTISRPTREGMSVAGNLMVWQEDSREQSQRPWMKFTTTDMQTIDQRDPDRDYARFREETIKEQQSLAEFQKQQEEINRNPTGPVMTMGSRTLQPEVTDGPSNGDGGGGDG